MLTINNPIEHGCNHEAIKCFLDSFKNIQYWCMCDEIGHEGTYHTHVYFYSPNAVAFDTVKSRMESAHIDTANGSHSQIRDYIRKEGKWACSEKHETNLPDTFEESGELPPERSRAETASEIIFSLIEDGASNADIIRACPSAFNKLPHIEMARQALINDRYKDTWRNLEVTYLWGCTGTGKTRSVMDRYGYSNVYRVTDYAHPFDGYSGQDVIIFEEFRSSLPIADMLIYLDGYPVSLPCRYSNKIACFTKIYIISNIPVSGQYRNI